MQLIQLGIRRSGNHAITQWLFPMLKDFIFLNMNEQIGILNPAALVQNGSFNVLLSFENIPLPNFYEYAENKNSFLVVRHPLNMLASSWEIYKNDELDRARRINDAIELYFEYARFTGDVIIYDEWLESKDYRKQIAHKLGLRFDDSNCKRVWGFGGSSFDDKSYLSRYIQVLDERFKGLLNKELCDKLMNQFEAYKKIAEL